MFIVKGYRRIIYNIIYIIYMDTSDFTAQKLFLLTQHLLCPLLVTHLLFPVDNQFHVVSGEWES